MSRSGVRRTEVPADNIEAAEVLWFDILGFANDRADMVLSIANFLEAYARVVALKAEKAE